MAVTVYQAIHRHITHIANVQIMYNLALNFLDFFTTFLSIALDSMVDIGATYQSVY